MIPRTLPQDTDWKHALRLAVTQPEELLEILDLPRARWLSEARAAAKHFPLKVPHSFIARMEKGNARDPLLLQVLPLAAELTQTSGYQTDPVGDLAATPVAGLIHKYKNRALLISTGACAVHCRYCFRRHYPYSESHAGSAQLDTISQYLHEHTELNEVILSGGDPLMLDDPQLARLLELISATPHIRWIRIHSRLPIVLPERLTSRLMNTLTTNKPVNLVIHCNHPNELSDSVVNELIRMHHAGIRVYNQSVLLRGINDNPQTLCNLSYRLFDAQVQPYYLHCLDPVQGAAHFDLQEQQAIAIYRQMQAELPGVLLPKLVRDNPGESSKTLINV